MSNTEKIFSAICWIIALYFGVAALAPFWPPPDITESGHYVFLLLAVFFALVPVAQKVELFKFLTFESRLGEVRKKQEEHGEQIKHLQMIQATLTNSLSNVNTNSNTVNNYYREQRVAAEEGIREIDRSADAASPEKATQNNDEGRNPFEKAMRGTRVSMTPLQTLLTMSVDLQVALRTAVGKSLEVYLQRKGAKYLTANQLWQKFIEQHPEQEPLEPSFEYFFNISNAAAHGQSLPDTDMHAAIGIGQRLIAEVTGDQKSSTN